MMISQQPIIILGMHRSGTSILAEILGNLGVFLGNDQNIHKESKFFLESNNLLLNVAHANWDYPLLFENLINEKTSANAAVNLLKSLVNNNSFKNFWGMKNLLTLNYRKIIWGWKEPRTTITFPIWHKLYPNAKYIFIIRNGVDVAFSLKNREYKRIGQIQNNVYSLRCLNIDEAFALWEEYNLFFEKYKFLINPTNLLYIKYEIFLEQFENEIKRVVNFLNMCVSETLIKKVSQQVVKANKYKFIKTKEGIDFYNKVKDTPLMRKYTYNEIL